MFYNSNFAKGLKEDTVPYGKLSIGNDVWIGQYAVILPSCKNIGAGAVVTKDIPPYAVAAGNPARVIKYRFDQDTIDKLEEIKWWDWDLQELKEHAAEFQSIDRLFSYAESRN